jgi:hypothetical protein
MATKKTALRKNPAAAPAPDTRTARKRKAVAPPMKIRKPAKKAAGPASSVARKQKVRGTDGLKIAVRNSPIHGRGVYAAAKIAKGERVLEYRGELISWKAADERPPSDPNDPNHTFLFSLSDGKRVIDASQNGNDARWINHSCDPNCETEEADNGRVYIEAIREIASGEELNYDYCLIIDEKLTKKLRLQYECRCGAAKCRGTMLALPKKKKKKKKK